MAPASARSSAAAAAPHSSALPPSAQAAALAQVLACIAAFLAPDAEQHAAPASPNEHVSLFVGPAWLDAPQRLAARQALPGLTRLRAVCEKERAALLVSRVAHR
jgi:hypothetical protein